MDLSSSCRPFYACGATRRQGSFLIKVVFVTLAIAGILAIVVPRYTNAEKKGKELTIKSFFRTITAVNKQYRSRYRKYADDLETLVKDAQIEAVLESTKKTRYIFSYHGGRHTWSCSADPDMPGPSHFFVDQTGMIRFRADGAAGSNDTKLE